MYTTFYSTIIFMKILDTFTNAYVVEVGLQQSYYSNHTPHPLPLIFYKSLSMYVNLSKFILITSDFWVDTNSNALQDAV